MTVIDPTARLEIHAERAELEQEVRRIIARSLSDLITMDAEDLVENTVAITHDVLKMLTDWSEQQKLKKET